MPRLVTVGLWGYKRFIALEEKVGVGFTMPFPHSANPTAPHPAYPQPTLVVLFFSEHKAKKKSSAWVYVDNRTQPLKRRKFIYNDMDGMEGRHHATWDKPGTGGQRPHVLICRWNLKVLGTLELGRFGVAAVWSWWPLGGSSQARKEVFLWIALRSAVAVAHSRIVHLQIG